jgi:ABC-2 type transport system permease protein
MLVAPLARSSLLIGRSLKEMAPVAAQALVIVLVMLPFGFRPHPLGALAGIVLLAVFGVGLGSLSYALALAVRKQDWMFWVVQQALLYPLMILSGMLLPLSAGPGWMRAAAHANPLTYVVDAERALFDGQFTATVGWGVLAAAVTAAVGLTVGIRAMLRSAD